MDKGPDVEYDCDMLERETRTAVGHTRHMQSIFGIEYPGDRGN